MSKTITLYNVDKIVSSAGTEVEIDNMSAGGSVSASGLALSRSEDSQNIDYAFNVGAASKEADGHSAAATHMMVTTSHSNQDIALLSFDNDGAHNQSFSGASIFTADAGYQEGVAGDNKMWMAGGLQTAYSNNVNTIDYLSFTDNSDGGLWASLANDFGHGSATSNGETAWTFGGKINQNQYAYDNADANQSNKFNFLDSSSVTKVGSLSTGHIYSTAVNDNAKALTLGGQISNSPFTHIADTQAFSLSSEGEAQQHSSLRTASYLNYSCNDLSKLFVHYGYDSGPTTTLDTMSFAAGETSTNYCSLTHGYGGAMASDGKGSGIAAGGYGATSPYNFNNASITKFNFEDSSTLHYWQTLNQSRHHHTGASGNG